MADGEVREKRTVAIDGKLEVLALVVAQLEELLAEIKEVGEKVKLIEVPQSRPPRALAALLVQLPTDLLSHADRVGKVVTEMRDILC